ncbi:MAG: hypothetical protein K2F64_05335 [Muribaculaceae bacterium]|nr:hypothetical protein [Muribaculaceae bacterium]
MTAYLTAIDIMSPNMDPEAHIPSRNVSPDTPLPDLLGKILDSPEHKIGVVDGNTLIGIIDETGMLQGLGRMIAARDDSSIICVDCDPSAYSASALAHAVEDADAHLVDLWTVPTDHDTIMATLRVRHSDPSACVHHLERYGFNVAGCRGASFADADIARERLLGLQALLNV